MQKKNAILVTSFGTTYADTRKKTIDAIEKKVRNVYSDYDVRRAFTSNIIRNILKKRDGINILSVEEALEQLVRDGFNSVIVQPTLLMNGFEYEKIISQVSKFTTKFEKIKVGKTILNDEKDFIKLISVLKTETDEYNNEKTVIIFAGHGSSHDDNKKYEMLNYYFSKNKMSNYFTATVEGAPNLHDAITFAKTKKASNVVLLPLMIVAGDHANNDIASTDSDSWKSKFEAQGFEVSCVLKGLGEYSGIQKIVINHIAEVI